MKLLSVCKHAKQLENKTKDLYHNVMCLFVKMDFVKMVSKKYRSGTSIEVKV